MVGGMGYAAGKAAAGRAARDESQEQRLSNVESQQAAPATGASAGGAPASSKVEQLKQLGELRDSGVLTAEEFEREKQKLLASD